MTTKSEIVPEYILRALLHVVGDKVRINDGRGLNDILDEAADKYPELFESLRAHPQYHHSEKLQHTLFLLKLGGNITYEGLSRYFTISKTLAGGYGYCLLSSFSIDQKIAIRDVAAKIRSVSPPKLRP